MQKNSLPSACSRWQNAANLARPLLESLVWLFLLKSMLGESLFWPLARLYLLNPQLFFVQESRLQRESLKNLKSWQFGNVSMLGGDWRSASWGADLWQLVHSSLYSYNHPLCGGAFPIQDGGSPRNDFFGNIIVFISMSNWINYFGGKSSSLNIPWWYLYAPWCFAKNNLKSHF